MKNGVNSTVPKSTALVPITNEEPAQGNGEVAARTNTTNPKAAGTEGDLANFLAELDTLYNRFVAARSGLERVNVRRIGGDRVELSVTSSGCLVVERDQVLLDAMQLHGSEFARRLLKILRGSGYGTVELIVEPNGRRVRARWISMFTELCNA